MGDLGTGQARVKNLGEDFNLHRAQFPPLKMGGFDELTSQIHSSSKTLLLLHLKILNYKMSEFLPK